MLFNGCRCKIVTDHTKRGTVGQSLKGINKMNPITAKKVAGTIIKNTYRTLMTRGMKGCYVYCVDKGLQEYLKSNTKVV